MTTPTPAQQLEEVLALQAAAKQSRARNEPATADQLEAYADEIILDMGRKHAPALRRALDAMEAVEGAEDCMCSDCNGDGVWHLEPCGYCNGHGNFKMVPAPKSADAVEVGRGE